MSLIEVGFEPLPIRKLFVLTHPFGQKDRDSPTVHAPSSHRLSAWHPTSLLVTVMPVISQPAIFFAKGAEPPLEPAHHYIPCGKSAGVHPWDQGFLMYLGIVILDKYIWGPFQVMPGTRLLYQIQKARIMLALNARAHLTISTSYIRIVGRGRGRLRVSHPFQSKVTALKILPATN
jgi:hypothetical protein